MIYIPIGIDCGNAKFLRKHNLRKFALPFDWTITYSGISSIIENNFENLIPLTNENFNAKYNVSFVHNDFPNDNDKIMRRINRFKNLLETSQEELIFIRKGHSPHHHDEVSFKIKSDIEDAEDLDNFLQKKYPNLKYKIIVILVCGKCFDLNKNYSENNFKNMIVHNIATPIVDDTKYENLCLNIFNLK